jgi:hypothetical protein
LAYTKCMFNVYKNQQSWQTGSRNLMGPKTLPTIWHTYMKLVTKYQIPVINSCWEKCDEKCAYMFNVHKNQLSRQTGSRNLTGPKMLPTIWHTYMKLVTKYQIPVINSCLEKCDEKCVYMYKVYNVYFHTIWCRWFGRCFFLLYHLSRLLINYCLSILVLYNLTLNLLT